MGDSEFNAFAAGDVSVPPTSYTLNRLADRFVDYLRETRPEIPAPGWPDFLIELATVERTIDEVFDGPGNEEGPALNIADLLRCSPATLLDAQLVPSPSLRLHALQFPVNDYYTVLKNTAFKDPSSDSMLPPWPEPVPTYLAIARRDYVVRRIPLEEAEYGVLEQLATGRCLGNAWPRKHPNFASHHIEMVQPLGILRILLRDFVILQSAGNTRASPQRRYNWQVSG